LSVVGINECLRELSNLIHSIKSRLGRVVVDRVNRSLLEYVDTSGTSKPLSSDFIEVHPLGNVSDYSLAYIDSSSRGLGTDIARIHVVSASALVNGLAVTVPDFSRDYVPQGTYLVGIKSSYEVLKSIEEARVSFIKVRDLVGNYYLPDYKDDDIGDELRQLIENYLISEVISSYTIDALVIDGPIYHLPTQALRSRYGDLFKELIKRRVSIVSNSDVPIVGFVKRVEFSRKLVRCREFRELLRVRLGRDLPLDTNDVLAMDLLMSNYSELPYLQPIVVGPMLYAYTSLPKELSNLPLTRVFWYVARRTPAGTQVARVEVLETHWRRWASVIEGVINYLLNSLTLRNVPLGIDVVDKLSKRLSGITYVLLLRSLSSVANLSYDEYDRLREVRRELGIEY